MQKLAVCGLIRRLSYAISADFNTYTFPTVPISVINPQLITLANSKSHNVLFNILESD